MRWWRCFVIDIVMLFVVVVVVLVLLLVLLLWIVFVSPSQVGCAVVNGRPFQVGINTSINTTINGADCPDYAPFNPFSVTFAPRDGVVVLIETTTCPPYGPKGWTNPARAQAVNSKFEIVEPTVALKPIPVGTELEKYDDIMYLTEDALGGRLGVLLNGVLIFGRYSPCGYGSVCKSRCPDSQPRCVIDPNAPSNTVDAVDAEAVTVDTCGGHSAPTGNYHVHSFFDDIDPDKCGFIEAPRRDVDEEHGRQLGFMFDGYGIHLEASHNPDDPMLDECNGHEHTIDGKRVYHYHFTDRYPWSIGCFHGCPSKEYVNVNVDLREYGCE